MMNSKKNALRHTQLTVRTVAFLSVISLFFFVAVAKENHHYFNELVQINHMHTDVTHWQQLVINPSNNQQFFIINTKGQMLLVDDMKNVTPVLDINTKNQDVDGTIKLTAIELHPNFALRDQPGYGTFYTAHIETLDKQSKTKRIQENNNELSLKFDAVITEWQFSSINYQKVDLNTKREVVRIAVPNNSMTIQQMSFSPHTKSWNDGFGLLYIALNGDEQRSEPLYSGVILRINPTKFGLRSFTIPNSNPFLKNHEIRDEIYLLGAQNIKQFIWSDRSSKNLLVSHQYNDRFMLSLVSSKGDWREKSPNNVIYQGEIPIYDILMYRGRGLAHLRNKLLILTNENQTWFVKSLKVKISVSATLSPENNPELEWQFNPQQLASENDVSFSRDFNGEVLMLDNTLGMIFQLPQESTAPKVPLPVSAAPTENSEKSTNNLFFLLFIFFVVGSILYFIIKRNTVSAKAIVRTRFAQLELSESQQQIGLYHRHKNTPDIIIDIIDIKMCEVMLNDTTISLIDRQVGQGFDNDKEQALRTIFTKEKVDKMIEGKMRQITLSLTDVHHKNYIICLYMRKGSDRVTKKSYSIVVEDLIDWCWLIASKINPDATEQRKEKPIISTKPLPDKLVQEQEKNSLHAHASVNKQATQPVLKVQTKDADLSDESGVRIEKQNAIDTNLVDALEKLVNLKQEGFLTEEEFTKAKENLMSSLFDK